MFQLILESRERFIAAQNQIINWRGRQGRRRPRIPGIRIPPAANEYRKRVNDLIQFQGHSWTSWQSGERAIQPGADVDARHERGAFLLAAGIAFWLPAPSPSRSAKPWAWPIASPKVISA